MKISTKGSFLAIILLVPAAGCLFQPREAEPPGVVNVDYLPRQDPLSVLSNLETAFTHLHASGYQDQIADDFTYEPDSDTQASYPNVDWASWNRDMEVAFITNFFNTVSAITANMTAETIQPQWSGDEAHLRYVYAMTVSEAGGETPYRGQVTLDFRLDGTYWKLYRWYDEAGGRDPDTQAVLPTLGQRRGAFAVQGGG